MLVLSRNTTNLGSLLVNYKKIVRFVLHGVNRNSKSFWHYVYSKLKTHPSIESFKLGDGTEAVTEGGCS